MHDFVHLHVHTQYSILDGQASVPRLVDKAIKDGMRGMAITDHGNMMAIKEFFNYTNKKNGPVKGEIKALKQKIKALKDGRNVASEEWDALPAEEKEGQTAPEFPSVEVQLEQAQQQLAETEKKLFKPIFGCEMYVAPRRLFQMDKDQGDNRRYHLIVLAKNQVGYHNLIKLVSKAWTDGFYGRPRTDRVELEAVQCPDGSEGAL